MVEHSSRRRPGAGANPENPLRRSGKGGNSPKFGGSDLQGDSENNRVTFIVPNRADVAIEAPKCDDLLNLQEEARSS